MKEINKYKILFFLRYFGDAFFYPFLSLYLQSIGLIEDKVGFIVSLTPILSIIAYPIYAKICSNLKKTKLVLTIIGAIEGLIILTIGFVSNFYILTILSILLSLFGTSHYGLLDSLSTVYCKQNNKSYSLIRMYGSIAYAISTTLGGLIASYAGYKVCFIIACIFFLLTSVSYAFIRPIEDDKKEEKAHLLDIFKSKKLIIFIIFYLLINGTAFSADHFLSLYLKERGISESQYGIIFSALVIVEVLTIFVLNMIFKKKKANIELLLLISAIAYALRVLSYFLYFDMPLLIAFTMLRGITYGTILYCINPYVVDIMGEKNGHLAIILMNMAYAIYQGICDNIFGKLIASYNYKTFYMIVFIIACLGTILGLVRFIYYKNKKCSVK